MAELRNCRKPDLQSLARELGVQIEGSDTIAMIIKKIESMEDYDKELAVNQMKFIVMDREEEKKREKERIDLEKEREFELNKIRLSKELEEASRVTRIVPEKNKLPLKSIMHKFDEKNSEISLFLNLFERQAKKCGIEEGDLVTNLLALLPTEIAEMLLREPEEQIDDYDFVKTKLLDRFKMTTEAYRQKLNSHQKSPNSPWKDLVFELNSFLEGWLNSLDIREFVELKDLLITEQIKKRVSHEVREHFIDKWAEFKDPNELVKQLDAYEAVKRPNKKLWNMKPSVERKIESPRAHEKVRPDYGSTETKANWREKDETRDRNKIFDKKRTNLCFLCKSPNHIRRYCPELVKRERDATKVNHVSAQPVFEEAFSPYLMKGLINEKEITILRDSGTNRDICPSALIKPDQLNGENIWLKTPLDLKLHCLPLADVTLEIGGIGRVSSVVAIANAETGLDYYLLGNETQKKLDQIREKPQAIVNAVVTRSQTRTEEQKNLSNKRVNMGERAENESELARDRCERNVQTDDTEEQEFSVNNEGEDSDVLPILQKDGITGLAEVKRDDFRNSQKNDPSLSEIRKKAEEKKSHFEIKNSLIVRKTRDNKGNDRVQLVVPYEFRDSVLKACHEGIAAHLGERKTKDKLLRYFFWPNVIREIESFVETCDPCQRVGKAGEKKIAPLKLVPVIGEIFTNLSCDFVGPLPKSKKGNRYLMTAICMSSHYPEAIAIPDIKSENAVEAFMVIFSRLGYPRIVKTDLGKSFVSDLTTTFLEKFGVRLTHSSVCHPQSNLIERWHRSVKRLLKVLCVENGEDWESNLPYALLALRTVTHDSTGFSPAELVHGRNLRTPETLLFEKWMGEEEEKSLVTEYVFNLVNRLKRCQDLAVENMTLARGKRKVWYDKKAVERKFEVGDEVLVLATNKPNKMSVSWIGPGKVEARTSETNYIISIPGRRERSQIYHVNLLKPYKKRMETVNVLMREIDIEEGAQDLEIIFPETGSEEYDFNKVIKESDLESRCTHEQLTQLSKLLEDFEGVFSNNPGLTNVIEHDIELKEDKPIRLRAYRNSPRQTEILRSEIKRMLELDLIEEGESEYQAPMILVEVPGKSPRPCIDYRKLNEITKAEFFPLPNIEERVEKVASAKFITVLDLTKGYWQIPLTQRARKIAGFVTSFGSYLPKVMPFGLLNASYRFSKFMSIVLRGIEEFCLPYLDDMAIFSDNWEEHMRHLEIVLRRVRDAKLTIKLEKCKFAQKTVKYLGHIVGEGVRRPAEAKILAIKDLPEPKNKTEIRRLLGMAGYYAHYIRDYASITEPLTRALKGKNKKEKIKWSEEMRKAFETLKIRLTEKPILFAPNYNRDFVIQTDASDVGIGVVLAQRDGVEEHPIIFLSRKFTEAEKSFCATEKECAGIIFAIRKLRHYIDGQKFSIETDHNPLVFLKRNAGNNPRLLRWSLALQQYHYAIKHRPGRDIAHVDYLSRVE